MNLNFGFGFASLATAIDERSWVWGAEMELLLPQLAFARLRLSIFHLHPRLLVVLPFCVRTAATLVSNSSETTLSLLC